MIEKPVVNMLWIGPILGRIELLSIASWLAAGHAVRLHAYDEIKNAPSSVDLIDGTRTAPFETMKGLRHKSTGSFALASDYFRYRLQQHGDGLWSDLDVVCLKPVLPEADVIFGMEDDTYINGAVLYLSKHLPITQELVGLFADNFIPPWTRRSRARKLTFKRLLGWRFSPADLPWGTYGPRAISELAHKHGLFEKASPREVFYPLSLADAHRTFDPAFSLESVITPSTLAVHLWNEALRELKNTTPPTRSPLGRLCSAYGI